MTATMLADRAVLRLSGDDVRGFLQGLVTHDLSLLTPARPLWAGLLTPQGKALFEFVLWDDGDAVLVDCERAQAAALTRRLAMYRLRRAIAIEPVAAAVHWSPEAGPGTLDPRLGALGRRWIASPAQTAEGWHRHRLGLGVVEGVAELGSGDTLWLECNAGELDGVSYAKGCYVGQENTARMHYRARVNRRLIVAPLGMRGDRTRAIYPDYALMIELRRIDALGDALLPVWLAAALSDDQRPTAE